MELIEKLKKLTESGIKIRDIEDKVGFPKNNLSNILAGKKELPLKWRAPLESYVTAKEESLQASMEIPEPWEEELTKIINNNRKMVWESMTMHNMVIWHTDENGVMKLVDPMSKEAEEIIIAKRTTAGLYTSFTPPPQFKNEMEKKLWEIQQQQKYK